MYLPVPETVPTLNALLAVIAVAFLVAFVGLAWYVGRWPR